MRSSLRPKTVTQAAGNSTFHKVALGWGDTDEEESEKSSWSMSEITGTRGRENGTTDEKGSSRQDTVSTKIMASRAQVGPRRSLITKQNRLGLLTS